jgi:CRP/FNR family transcriptional regulator, anaerobic regulatory protein
MRAAFVDIKNVIVIHFAVIANAQSTGCGPSNWAISAGDDEARPLNSITSTEAWTGVADCLNCNIRQAVLFAGLDETGFNGIHRPISQLQYAAGAAIYEAEDEGASLFTVRTGLVKLTHFLPDGGQRIVRLARKTDVLGLECLIVDKYQHSAIVLQQAEVCRLPVAAVKRLLHGNPRLFHTLMAQWYRALSDAGRWITELSTGAARDRVIRLLLWLSEAEDGSSCSLFSREDLGAVLGLTTETASRAMAALKREGLIQELSPNRFTCDIARLHAVLNR